MIAIIDYGLGNLRSVQKAFERLGEKARITYSAEVIQQSDKVVLPGVGAIAPAMRKLQELALIDVIHASVNTGKPFLGICVGFQLLFDSSTEGGDVKGLGIIPGTVQRFNQLKVPHMGWNQLQIQPNGQPMFEGVDDGANVYFCHSYYARPIDDNVIATKTDYGVQYASSIRRDNVWGVQFHPEKSQAVGLKLLENFVKVAK